MGGLQLPYESHPAFHADRPVAISAGPVAEFAAAYSKLERTLATDERTRIEAIARAALGEIWRELSAHHDAEFGELVGELRQLSQRLLDTDLAHFSAQRAVAPTNSELERQRFWFTRLTSRTVSRLQAIAAAPLDELRANAARGRVSRDDLSINVGPIPRDLVHVLDGEFERQGVHAAVSAYARRPMRVSGVALELSVPTATWWRNQYDDVRAPQTLYAHTDEGIANPKAIVYLTDVDKHTGAMSVFPGCEERLALTPLQRLVGRIINSVGTTPGSPSHALYARASGSRPFASPLFRRHFAMLPEALRYNSHVGWDVLPGSELERALMAAETPMYGPPGTTVVFDGARVIHRGGMVERGERVALQVVFAAPSSRLVAAAGRLAGTARSVVASGRDWRALRRRVGHSAQQYSPRLHHRLERAIARLLPPLAVVDVGASYYPHPPWEVFRASPRTTWIAVEPNQQNTAYLASWYWPSTARLVPTGLSEHGGEQTLYVTHTDSGSSLLPPVIGANMEHRVTDRSYFFPLTERRIETLALDSVVADLAGPLLVKLDTQGTELSILRGAERAFSRIVAIETEATLLASPVMVGSGKLWEICQFLEARGFELLQLKPIEGGPERPGSALARRTYLNECDAVFCLTRTELAKRPAAHQLAALGVYLSYHLYAEARALLDVISGLDPAVTAQVGKLLDS
jgi:FkbM family methyltransferase